MKWIVAVAIVLGLTAWLLGRSPRGEGESLPALRRELRSLTHDSRVAKRLVEAEAARSPELSEATVLRRVIRRLRHDRHR